LISSDLSFPGDGLHHKRPGFIPAATDASSRASPQPSGRLTQGRHQIRTSSSYTHANNQMFAAAVVRDASQRVRESWWRRWTRWQVRDVPDHFSQCRRMYCESYQSDESYFRFRTL